VRRYSSVVEQGSVRDFKMIERLRAIKEGGRINH
jgi:hypothetical protein